MDNNEIFVLKPPDNVRGMQVLSKDAFTKRVKIPCIRIEKKQIQKKIKLWKKQQLDIMGLKSIIPLSEGDVQHTSHSLILLDPAKLSAHPFSQEAKKQLGIEELQGLEHYEVELTYNNWKLRDIIQQVLPADSEAVSSFTLIGHIAHLNLREHLLPYSSLIGEVILDKVSTVKTVINKLGMIDNTFRNFKIDLLAGEENFVTQVGENGCLFELDFSKVYWNSRLGEEHSRIVTCTPQGSVVYDVFAGVGPFAVPLAKKKTCKVFANDLNPSSYEYLQKNVTLNKTCSGLVDCFNLDGREFIKTVVKKDLTDSIISVSNTSDCSITPRTIVMNLPALAVDFLNVFPSLLQDLPPSIISQKEKWVDLLPIVHCYSFVKINEDLGDDAGLESDSNMNKDNLQNISNKNTLKTANSVKIQQSVTLVKESPDSLTSNEFHVSDKSRLKENRTQITESMESQLRRRAKAALTLDLPEDTVISWVRKVSNNKDMVRLSFRLWPELLIGSLTQAEEGSDEPEAKRQKL